MSCLITLLRYRFLHEFRHAMRGARRHRLKFLLTVLGTILGVGSGGAFFLFLVKSATPLLHAGDATRQKVLEAGLLVMGAMVFLILCLEVVQQFWFASDAELLAVAPIHKRTGVAYRALFALAHGAPWVVMLFLFPVFIVSAFPQVQPATKLLFLILLVSYWAWLAAAAVGTASLVAALADRWQIGRHVLHAIGYVTHVALIAYVMTSMAAQFPANFGNFAVPAWSALFPPRLIAELTVRVHSADLSCRTSDVLAMIASLGFPPLMFVFAAVKLWHRAARPVAAAHRTGGAAIPRSRSPRFSTSRSWLFFQKDVRDLGRNPRYRYAPAAALFLLLAGLWAQARKSTATPFLMIALSLMYLVPLLISARAVAQEFRLLELYKLVLPSKFSPLDVKLRYHSAVNCIAILVLSLPLFLLLKPGPQWFTALYFVGATLLSVPVLTALALALGTYFPVVSDIPSAIGIKAVGIIVYILLGSILFSFLVNWMYLGTGIYLVSLAAMTAILFRGARRRLYSLIERRPH